MTYSDDILNVNAYLRSKMRKNANDSQALLNRMQKQGEEYRSMIDQSKSMLAEAQAMAAQLGVDLSDLELPQEEATNKFSWKDSTELLISLPKDYDFAKAFEELRQEAHAAGFTNVQPEDLLSPEEMASAEAFYAEIESRFEKATKLRGKDIFVMTIAIALRIICKAVFPLFKFKGEAPDLPTPDEFIPAEVTQPEPYWTAPPEIPAVPQETAALDAFSGVSVGDVIRTTKNVSGTIAKGEQILSRVTGKQPKTVGIKGHMQIVSDPIPFDIPDNEHFAHKDALGYNRWFGWLFGVLNIMTDTVTTSKMSSFSVIQPFGGAAHPTVNQKISTLMHLLLPVMTNTPSNESMLAAVMREAVVLRNSDVPPEVIEILGQTFASDEKTRSHFQTVGNVMQTVIPKIGTLTKKSQDSIASIIFDVTRDAAITAFLNQLITAIHIVMYNPETDGPADTYAIRTNTILTTSNVISAVCNSIPALITKNPAKIDFAGVITSCLSMFNSTRFWIDVKADYLFNSYMPGIEEQMSIVDKYFVFTEE